MVERRRLPVIQTPPPDKPPAAPDEQADARPPWHWVGFGTVAIFAAWLPLSYVAGWVVRRGSAPYVGDAATPEAVIAKMAALTEEQRLRVAMIQMLPHVLGLALASFAGGFLVGRFGPGVREAALAGVMTSLVAVSISCSPTALSWASLVAVVIAVAFSAWGGRAGQRSKR